VSADGSRLAELILARLAEILERVARVEHRMIEIAEDVDALDRVNRPYGDGTRLPRKLRRGR